jgi:hypothetical protein
MLCVAYLQLRSEETRRKSFSDLDISACEACESFSK